MAQPRRNLSVELRLNHSSDPHPTRSFILKSPTYAIRIGRGSKSGNRELFPASYNAWFDSRVMSREHAVLKADPDTRAVYIEDVGSMHGTYVGDKRIRSHERHLLHYDSLVKFGNEVTRGPESFPPLHVVVRYSWVDDSHTSPRSQNKGGPFHTELPQNTFKAPEYDDEDDEEEEEEEDDDDDDISFVQETVLKPKLEMAVPSVTGAHQDCSQSYIPDTVPGVAGQAMDHWTYLSPPSPPSPIALSRSNEAMADLSCPPIYIPVPDSGPSGLTDAERQTDKRALNRAEKPASSETSMFADSESPVKTSSSLPTSSPSNEAVEQLEARAKELVAHQTPTQPASLKTRITATDEDLTQSESDADEGYSPNLMVDDSDEGQRHDVPTDYGSDSDEEALLMAENRGTKSARVEDSTDSESSCSDSSNDIGLDQDEDFFDHTASKTSNTKNPLPSGDFSDYEKEIAEQGAVPYNMRPGNFTIPCTRLGLPSNPLNRAPSPSDAAMAKPCDFATSSPGALNSAYPYSNPQTWVGSMASDCGTAWPTNASYDCGFQYPYGASYTPDQINTGPFRAYHSAMSTVSDRPFTSDQSGTREPDRSSGSGGLQPQSQPQSVSTAIDLEKSSGKGGCLSPDTLQSGAKVSIDNIVERLPKEPMPSPHGNQLKRKADDMAIDVLGESTRENSDQISQADSSFASTGPPQKKAVTAAQVKALQTAACAGVGVAERSLKRARTEKSSRNTSFTALATTAVAGAIVGGVGVVAALVALPPDFFV